MTNGLRDTGHNGMLIIHPSLAKKNSTWKKNCKNARCFLQEIELSVARVFFRSSVLGCERDLLIDAAVSSTPFALGYNMRNRLFQIFPKLTDVISCVRPTETYGSDSDLTVPLEVFVAMATGAVDMVTGFALW